MIQYHYLLSRFLECMLDDVFEADGGGVVLRGNVKCQPFEQFFSALEVSLHGGDCEAFAKTSRTREKEIIAGRYKAEDNGGLIYITVVPSAYF